MRTRIKLPTDPYADERPRRPRPRAPFVVIGVVLVAFLVIALVNRGHSAPSRPAAAASSSAGPNPSQSPTAQTVPYSAGQASDTADGIPVGYPHSVAGAEAAAANYASAIYTTDMVYPWDRHKLVNAIADPAIASSLQGQFDAAYSQLDTRLGLTSSGTAPSGESFMQRASAVGVSLVSDSGDTAVVSVWEVTLAGLVGGNTQEPVSEDWVTVTVTLNWTHGDWKWFSYQSADGPAPLGGLQTPAAGSTLQAAVTKYGELRYGR